MAFNYPNAPSLNQEFTPAGGPTYVWNGYGWSLKAITFPVAPVTPPHGRLTLQTATPVMTTTLSGRTTIYYTPTVGNFIPIYDGTNLVVTPFIELSVATTDTTKSPAAIGANKNNDWFVWNDAGTLRLGHGPDWTDDVTRSPGTALVRVGGILLNSVSITNGPAASRGTYVGTTRSDASSQLGWIYGGISAGGTAGFFGVWNAYNRRLVSTLVGDSAASWTYGSTTWRAANNSATIRASLVVGLNEDVVIATYYGQVIPGTSQVATSGVGLDVTNAATGVRGQNSAGGQVPTPASYRGTIGIGFHFFSALERNSGATASTWIGNSGNDSQSGLFVDFWA